MHHLNGVDEVGQRVQHGSGVIQVQWLAELLNGVEKLQVVFCLISGISDTAIQLTPLLGEGTE